ncbi:hypothetical protein AVT69_gp271 [Pseudomonas phage PhiPA3]|uniref:Uncharacterized protein 273 n=1 Tax=Pseudomonas phage PhiPA3 TaxID=998086 RepID=F8SJB0_BPPA3|nr:hypothetical protein AVT69_gp271 [Pseudomonas phage PhiPA3]AEH03696.1 hypothetical protein [Pseudomonas phage PhiPA3]
MSEEDYVASQIQHGICQEFRKAYKAKIAVYNCEDMRVSLVYEDGRVEHYQLQHPTVVCDPDASRIVDVTYDFSMIVGNKPTLH